MTFTRSTLPFEPVVAAEAGEYFCRYFRTYLRVIADHRNIQISVHCDVLVFSWLLQWAKAQHGQAELPKFSLWNCLQIMISSEFLQVGSCPSQ